MALAPRLVKSALALAALLFAFVLLAAPAPAQAACDPADPANCTAPEEFAALTTLFGCDSINSCRAMFEEGGLPAPGTGTMPCTTSPDCLVALFPKEFGCSTVDECKAKALAAVGGGGGGAPSGPPCTDQASCEAEFFAAFDCTSMENCQAKYFSSGADGSAPAGPPCTDEASCTAAFNSAFGCSDPDSCQAKFFGSGSSPSPSPAPAQPQPAPSGTSSGSTQTTSTNTTTTSTQASGSKGTSTSAVNRRRVALRLACLRGRLNARVMGADRPKVRHVTFFLGSRRLGRDGRNPFTVKVPRRATSAQKVRAVVTFTDRSTRTLSRSAKRCARARPASPALR